MKIEHIALNVEKVKESADWYVKNLNMTIVRKVDNFPYPIFLADEAGHTVLEFYRNDTVEIPSYWDVPVWNIHIAFNVDNIERVMAELVARGAVAEKEIVTVASGDKAGFVRDLNGVPLQIIERIEPL